MGLLKSSLSSFSKKVHSFGTPRVCVSRKRIENFFLLCKKWRSDNPFAITLRCRINALLIFRYFPVQASWIYFIYIFYFSFHRNGGHHTEHIAHTISLVASLSFSSLKCWFSNSAKETSKIVRAIATRPPIKVTFDKPHQISKVT